MLSRSNRIPTSEVSRILRGGRRIHGDVADIIFQNTQSEYNRFAFIVSTKIDKRATTRNRIRRLFNESVRHILPTLTKRQDIIIIARKNISDSRQADIEKIVDQLLHKISI